MFIVSTGCTALYLEIKIKEEKSKDFEWEITGNWYTIFQLILRSWLMKKKTYTLRKSKLKKTHVPQCLLQHYLQ